MPTQAQNGPSNWSVSKQTSNSVTIDCNGIPLFTLTNNGNGTSNLDYCNWHFVVRNSDHKILGNVDEVSVSSQNNTHSASATQQNADNKAAIQNNTTTTAQTDKAAINNKATNNHKWWRGVFIKDNAKVITTNW